MAVICQVLIIQPHKHKHREMNLEESTHFHNRLCKMPLTRRGVFTPKFLFTSSLDNYSCSQHFKYDRVRNSWHWSNCREPRIQNGYINNFINKERALNQVILSCTIIKRWLHCWTYWCISFPVNSLIRLLTVSFIRNIGWQVKVGCSCEWERASQCPILDSINLNWSWH